MRSEKGEVRRGEKGRGIRRWRVTGVVRNGCGQAGVLPALLACLLGVAPVAGQEHDPYGAVVTANEAFSQGRYEEALAGYEAAAKTLGDSPELDYNRAAARYKLEQYEPAANLLARAALSPDPELSRRARFNWGNCDYATALVELAPVLASATPNAGVPMAPAGGQPDLQKGMDKLQSAIRHYRRALDPGGDAGADHPTDRAARENIERAQRLMDLLEELKQQQQQQQKQQQDQQQDQDQQNQDDQQEQEGQDQQKEQQQDENQQQPEPQDQPEPDQPQDTQDQQPQPDEQQEREMTPQEAEAVLQAVRDTEKQRREEKARRIRRQRVPVVKDW